jgi:hypothetical protein
MITKIIVGVSLLISTLNISAQTKEEVYIYLLQIGCDEAEIVTKQSVEECGHYYQSNNATLRNNLFGLWNHAKQQYYSFNDWKESCDAYLTMIQYKRNKNEDYYEFLTRIGYASNPDYIWNLKHIKL